MHRVAAALPLLGLLGLLAACADGPDSGSLTATTPTEQYKLETEQHPYEVRLAAHAGGLSRAQSEAVAGLAERWRESGGGRLVIQVPTVGLDPKAAFDTSLAAHDLLVSLGAPPERVERVGYQPQGPGPAPIIVGFLAYEAVVPNCGRDWDNLASTSKNKPMRNFGCALTANMAAQIANPADIVEPQAEDPVDASRRTAVFAKYRKGETTSSSKDAQASGTLSTAAGGSN